MVYYLVKNYWYYIRAYTILVNDGMIQNKYLGHSLYSRFFTFQYHYEDISMVTEFGFKKPCLQHDALFLCVKAA